MSALTSVALNPDACPQTEDLNVVFEALTYACGTLGFMPDCHSRRQSIARLKLALAAHERIVGRMP